jgi:hypothetical protein
MTKMNIPDISITIVLSEVWKPAIYGERRNSKLLSKFGYINGCFTWFFSEPSDNYNWVFYKSEYDEMDRIWKNVYHSFKHEHDDLNETDKRPAWNTDKAQAMLDNMVGDKKFSRFEFVYLLFPAGTELKIDRIYIRKVISDYSSLSFWAKFPDDKKKYRFWAKLEDVNNIVYDRYIK